MTAVKTLQQLPQLFRYADVEKFTGNANVFLTRALQNGLVERIVRGVYVNAFLKNRPKIEEVACFLRTPSYISCEWALNRHGILLQSPVVCTVLTLSTAVGSARNVQYGGVTIEFSHLAPRLFTGFETRDGFNLALPEKALLDTIYLRKAIPFRDELELALLDRKRLDRMAKDFPGPTRKLAQTIRLCLQGTGAKKN
jgi:predicted transcriptional regulator of viral defense system